MRLRFGNSRDAYRETVLLGKVGIVGLVFLDEEVVTAPNGADQGESQGASYRQGKTMPALLRCLFVTEALRLGQCFASKAGIAARLNNGNKNIMREFNAASVMPVLIGQKPAVH